MGKITIMEHPLIQHKIGWLRKTDTGSRDFREMVGEIAMLLCYEATRNLELEDVEIETPICTTTVKALKGKKLAVVPILRAGLGMVDGMLGELLENRDGSMLATGGSAVAAIKMLKDKGVRNIHFLCIIAAPEGVEAMKEDHPDVDVYIGSLDEGLNSHGYIVPGLGDAGDRIFGTK